MRVALLTRVSTQLNRCILVFKGVLKRQGLDVQASDATMGKILYTGTDYPVVNVISEFTPDEAVQPHMNARDICALPYRDLTTSGAAFGRKGKTSADQNQRLVLTMILLNLGV